MNSSPSHYVAPSPTLQAFNCPHCSAYAAQNWSEALANETVLPQTLDGLRGMLRRTQDNSDQPLRLLRASVGMTMLDAGLPFTWFSGSTSRLVTIANCNFSKCVVCNKIAVWINNNLIFPRRKTAPAPSNDLPASVLRDFEEARSILDASPRGAAALLRLCVQKLCGELGGSGKNIDADIALLVSQGLRVDVQQALDVVRVVGNESVHPGKMDMEDDHDTATALFNLVNFIADQMITQPKAIAALYGTLPPAKVKAIEQRDSKKPA